METKKLLRRLQVPANWTRNLVEWILSLLDRASSW